jgi:cell division protein FtsL
LNATRRRWSGGARLIAAPRARVSVAVVLIMAAIVMAIGVFHVSRRKQIVSIGYRLSDAREQVRHLREENRKLRLESSVLTNPARIERLAGALGMQRATPNQIRVVRVGHRSLARAK